MASEGTWRLWVTRLRAVARHIRAVASVVQGGQRGLRARSAVRMMSSTEGRSVKQKQGEMLIRSERNERHMVVSRSKFRTWFVSTRTTGAISHTSLWKISLVAHCGRARSCIIETKTRLMMIRRIFSFVQPLVNIVGST